MIILNKKKKSKGFHLFSTMIKNPCWIHMGWTRHVLEIVFGVVLKVLFNTSITWDFYCTHTRKQFKTRNATKKPFDLRCSSKIVNFLGALHIFVKIYNSNAQQVARTFFFSTWYKIVHFGDKRVQGFNFGLFFFFCFHPFNSVLCNLFAHIPI